MHTGKIVVPPDSTGKAVVHKHVSVVTYTNESDSFALEETVLGETSGAQGTVVGINTFVPCIYVASTRASNWEVLHFTDGENLRQNGSVIAEVQSSDHRYFPAVAVTSGDNPVHSQFVDGEGQAYTRFAEGAPLLDATGVMKTSDITRIGDYWMTDDASPPNSIQAVITGNATMVPNPSKRYGTAATTITAGDKIIIQTDKHHPVVRGRGILATVTLAMGDAGKNDHRRRVGYFNDKAGVFLELDGTDLYLVLRTYAGGSPTDTRVHQDDWIADQLDGTGVTSTVLDITKVNTYWFNIYDGDRVRFGIFGNERGRVVAHWFSVANALGVNNFVPHWGLPLRMEMENLLATGSSSEVFFMSGTVSLEGPPREPNVSRTADLGSLKAITLGVEVPVMTIQLAEMHDFGGGDHVCRTVAVLQEMDLLALLNTDTSKDTPVKISIIKNGALTGASFVAAPDSPLMEIDTSATAITGGDRWFTHYVSGVEEVALSHLTGMLREYLCNNVDSSHPSGSINQTYTFVAEAMVADAQVRIGLTWDEYRM